MGAHANASLCLSTATNCSIGDGILNILCIGDVVGSIGCQFLRAHLPALKKTKAIDLVIANGENSADGNGITPDSARYLLDSGVGVLDQFIGKSAADGTLSVGTNVDAITGATVSTRGVTTGVNTALAAVGAMG